MGTRKLGVAAHSQWRDRDDARRWVLWVCGSVEVLYRVLCYQCWRRRWCETSVKCAMAADDVSMLCSVVSHCAAMATQSWDVHCRSSGTCLCVRHVCVVSSRRCLTGHALALKGGKWSRV